MIYYSHNTYFKKKQIIEVFMILIFNLINKTTVLYDPIHYNDLELISSEIKGALNPDTPEQIREEILHRIKKELEMSSFSEKTDFLSEIMIFTNNFKDHKNAINIMSYNMGLIKLLDRIYVDHFIRNNVLFIQTQMIDS